MSQINWSWLYRPRIHIGSVAFDLPLPIMQTNERYSQDYKQIKVPLQNGVVISGVSRGALQLQFDGTISRNTLSGVLNTKDAMVDLLNKNSGIPFTMYRYYDPVKQNYRWYENCICHTLSFSPKASQVYSLDYSMSVIVPSGVEHTLITTVGELPTNVTGGNVSGYIRGGVVQGDDRHDFVSNEDTLPDDRSMLYGPMLIKLADSAGESAFMVMNSDGDIVFKVDSLGRVRTISPFALARSITVN